MARNTRRLILWMAAGVAALVLLALLAVLVLVWVVNPNVYRGRIESTAFRTIGRPVHLTGNLSWHVGTRLSVGSDDGSIENAPGFAPEPLIHWKQLRFGLATWPLLRGRIEFDHVEIDGLTVNLQRDAAGRNNWQFAMTGDSPDSAGASPGIRIMGIEIREGELQYRDAATGADWRAGELQLNVQLPEDLGADLREFSDVKVSARLHGGSLASQGLAVSFSASRISHHASTGQLVVPAFTLAANDASLRGELNAMLDGDMSAGGKVSLVMPSLRAMLKSVGVTPPPTQDASTLGRLSVATQFSATAHSFAAGILTVELDDTKLNGSMAVPAFSPLSLRFDLSGDRIDVDRYMAPEDVKGEPFALPLAQLKALDAKGVLRVQNATGSGLRAHQLRIDVE